MVNAHAEASCVRDGMYGALNSQWGIYGKAHRSVFWARPSAASSAVVRRPRLVACLAKDGDSDLRRRSSAPALLTCAALSMTPARPSSALASAASWRARGSAVPSDRTASAGTGCSCGTPP